MAESADSPPPPPPSSPPPSLDLVKDTPSSADKFKALQKMLAANQTMYTSTATAPPPKRNHASKEEQESPALEHRTRDRPPRKTRAPSRTSLRERTLYSSSNVFETENTESPDAGGAPPPINGPSPQKVEGSPPSSLPASPSLLPSPPLSHPPSPPLSLSPSFPPTIPPNTPPTCPLIEPYSLTLKEDSIKKTMVLPVPNHGVTSSKTAIQKGTLQQSFVPSQPKTMPTHHPLISVVPFVSPERSISSPTKPTLPSSSASTFTSRLRQIRDRRALQRKSPLPATLSPTHSTSSLPQYLLPLSEIEETDPSHVSLHSLSVSPVTSLASLGSSVRGDNPEHDSNSLPMESDAKVKNTVIQDTNSGNVSLLNIRGSSVGASVDHVEGMEVESSGSSTPPSLPPSPPPSPPPTLPPDSSPMLTVKHTLNNTSASKEDVAEPHFSSESLSSPELPALPPPPPIPASFDEENKGVLLPSLPTTTADVSSPFFDTPLLLPDIAEINSTTTYTESSTPSISSGTSTPRKSDRVQLRRPYYTGQYRPERRSAFESMLISESSVNKEGKKRLSVAERRALTLKASRRPDGDSNPVMKRWSNTENLVSASSHEDDRAKSALAMFGSVEYTHQSLQGDRFKHNSESGKRDAQNRSSMPVGTEVHQHGAVPESGQAMQSLDIRMTKVIRKRWLKQANVSDDSSGESGSNLPLASQSRRSQDSLDTMSCTSSQDTEKTQEKEQYAKDKSRESVVSPVLGASLLAINGGTLSRLERYEEHKQAQEEKKSSILGAVLSSMDNNLTQESEADEEKVANGGLRENASSKETVDESLPQGVGPHGYKRKGLRSVDSLISETSLHRQALEAELEGPLSARLSSLQEMQTEQNRVVESRLQEMQEQRRESERLLEGEPDSFHMSNSFQGGYEDRECAETGEEEEAWEPASAKHDDLEDDPQTWSVEQVCEWLELVGLGTYRDTFRAELGVDSAEIRELFLSKIYELSNPSGHTAGIHDDFRLSVDSYTDQDWKKLQAAVDALKSPVLRDDIELDPSAIGQYLHTDYIHSLSTPNINELKFDMPVSETDVSSPPPPSLVPHSSTMHSFPNYALVGPAAATDQMPRRARVPSTRSIKRKHILSMAEAGDRFNRGNSSSQMTRPASSLSSMQGSPILSGRSSYSEMPTVSPNKTGNISKKKTKKKEDKTFESSAVSPISSEVGAVCLAKNLNQGVIVYEDCKYRKVRLGSLQKQTTEDAMSSTYWEQPTSAHTTGLVRLYMETVQEGVHYKAFLVTVGTSAGELVEKALQRAHITDNPHHYCIWQVASASNEINRVLASSECPLTLQLDWPQFNSHHFELRIQENTHRVKFSLDLPLCSENEVRMTLSSSATATEAVWTILAALHLTDAYSQQGIQCAIMDITSRTRAERALGEKECPVSLLNTGHKLKVVSLSGAHKRQSVGQSDKALLARIHTLEQEKAMLSEQVQSAQVMLRSYLETEQHRPPAWCDSNYTDSEQTQQRPDTAGEPNRGTEPKEKPSTGEGALSSWQSESEDEVEGEISHREQSLRKQKEEVEYLSLSGSKLRAGEVNDATEDAGVSTEGEKVIERLRRLNDALNKQLQKQSDKIKQQIKDNQRLEQKVLNLSNKDKEMVLEIGVLRMSIKGLKDQLLESERSREQLQQSLQAIDRSQKDQVQLDSLQGGLRHAEQEIARLENVSREQEARLHAAEQERHRAVRSVRHHVVHSMAEEKEEEDLESVDLYKASRTDLVRSCRRANRELHQHKLYLDQLLSIVIDRHPQVLTMVSEAQRMRDLVDRESWC